MGRGFSLKSSCIHSTGVKNDSAVFFLAFFFEAISFNTWYDMYTQSTEYYPTSRASARPRETAAMRAHTRVIAPALPLVYALRLSWAEPRALLATNSATRRTPAFGGPAPMFTKRCQSEHSQPRRGSRLLPWAHALPLDEAVTRPRRPRVLKNARKDVGVDFTFSGERRLRRYRHSSRERDTAVDTQSAASHVVLCCFLWLLSVVMTSSMCPCTADRS